MDHMTPKEQHERHLASVDKALIVNLLSLDADQDITRIAVALARQCDLLVHFRRLWTMRVSELDQRLNTEAYTRDIFVNRRALYKELSKPATV
jgi:hypothetical protein